MSFFDERVIRPAFSFIAEIGVVTPPPPLPGKFTLAGWNVVPGL